MGLRIFCIVYADALTLARKWKILMVRLCFFLWSSFLVSSLTLAQEMTTLPFTSQQSLKGASQNLAGNPLPWVVGAVALVLFGIILISLWPRRDDESLYQRQRKFARVDNLYFKIKAHLLADDESKRFLKDEESMRVPPPGLFKDQDELIVVGLSVGGCSLLAQHHLKKGMVIFLRLDSLPDFPAQNLLVGAKVIWTRTVKENNKISEIAGTKFVYVASPETTDSLKQYLNYLMDEPVT